MLLNDVDATPVSDQLTTAPAVGTGTVSFVVFGDSGSGEPEQKQLAELMAQQFRAGELDLAIHTGDIVYPSGTYHWLHKRFFDVYEEWLRRWPVFFALGNHEYDRQRPAISRPLRNAGKWPRPVLSRPPRAVFQFRLRTDSLHLAWHQRVRSATVIANSSSPGWSVISKRPRSHGASCSCTSRAYGSSDLSSTHGLRTTLQPVFERYGVQVVFAGHEHDYARGAPWHEQPSAYSPVMHVVTGGGGAGLNTPTPGPWLVRWASAYHYLSVKVTDCRPSRTCELTLDAIGLNGQPFDNFTLPLRAQQVDAAPPGVSWIAPAAGANSPTPSQSGRLRPMTRAS